MKITLVEHSSIDKVNFDELEFGTKFTDYMLTSDFDGSKWSAPSIEPLKHLSIHPGSAMLHYGQTIFEGLKAYKTHDGRINIFRLRDNLERLNRSAARMQMAQIDVDQMFEALKKYIEMQRDWVPTREQGSLYIRPFIIATDDTLRARPSLTYKFIIIASPVGFYYSKPLSVGVETTYSRAARGGVGYAKAGGNYGASFFPAHLAKKKGHDQILWTDINNGYSIEELGSANFFFMTDEGLVTPEPRDSVLRGITRDTVIHLAHDLGLNVLEMVVPVDELRELLKNNKVRCMFATGTAAAITFVNSIDFGDEVFTVRSDECQPISDLRARIDKLKFLESDTYPEWNVVV